MKPFPPLRLVREPGEPGRNAPCPCGSGKRYRLCHGKANARPLSAAQRFHATSDALRMRLLDWADELIGEEWGNPLEIYAPDDPNLPFDATIKLFIGRLGDQPMAEYAMDKGGFEVNAIEREIMRADLDAWLSIWEVVDVTPSKGMTLVDQLTGIERTVEERTASMTLRRRDSILARMATYQDIHLLAGVHPMALPPIEAGLIVAQMRKRLRRKTAVPVERVREYKHATYLIDRWDDTAAEYRERRSRSPEFVNTDGEPMLLTEDHFAVKPGNLVRVLDELADLPEVDVEGAGERDREIIFLSGDRTAMHATVHAVLRPTPSGVVLETNSLARADRFRRMLEEVVGTLARHTLRVHPSHIGGGDAGPVGGGMPPESDVPLEMLRAFMDQYYRDWLDQPVPALDNQKPREAAKSKAGRAMLEILLKSFEHQEGGMMPEGAGPDIAAIRRELGMDGL